MGKKLGAKNYKTWQEEVKRHATAGRKYLQYQFVKIFDKLIRKE